MKKILLFGLLALSVSCKKEDANPNNENCDCWEVIDKNVFNGGGTTYGTATYQNVCTGELQDVSFTNSNPAIGYVNCTL